MTHENLLSLVEKYESPLYVYDAEKIISQYNKLQSAFETAVGFQGLKIDSALSGWKMAGVWGGCPVVIWVCRSKL